ncbi:hypothetical protein GFS60_01968 [Rhodococcus sp. WAY2]|nr:hypothetical protein GFS60_01968 [Rhodococcus sp. WAY2]
MLSRHHQIALVLPVLVIEDDDDFTACNGVQSRWHGIEPFMCHRSVVLSVNR